MKLLIITQKVDQNDQLLGFFIEWIKRFAVKFEKITVVCLEKSEFNLPQNVEVISLGKDRGFSKLRQFSTFYSLLFILKYNAVFVHMNPIWVILGGWFWKLARKKIFFWYTSGGVTLKLKLAEKLADIILTASKESFRLLSKKVIITGHGIDTGLFRPATSYQSRSEDRGSSIAEQSGLPAISLRILSVGRIAPVKNYEILIGAAKILKDRGFEFSVTMVGEAPPLKKDQEYLLNIKNKIKNLGLEKYFNFVGKVNHNDLPQYYQSHDVFVHLSKTGSVDKTLLEAMACGINVLSSNDASRQFLAEELLFNGDDADDLSYKISRIKGKDYGRELRNYVVANHNLDKLIEKISNIIYGTGN